MALPEPFVSANGSTYLTDGLSRCQSVLVISACLSAHLSACLSSQGFLDIDLTDLRKGGANITGFQLVNNSDPGVSQVVQQWMEFDNKDVKMPKRSLKVSLL